MWKENMKLMLQIARKFYGTSVCYTRWTKVFVIRVGLKRFRLFSAFLGTFLYFAYPTIFNECRNVIHLYT